MALCNNAHFQYDNVQNDDITT